jgi:hypothetical protein
LDIFLTFCLENCYFRGLKLILLVLGISSERKLAGLKINSASTKNHWKYSITKP